MATDKLARHTVVSHKKWIAARKKLLLQEKAFTRARERLNKTSRALPWEQIEKTLWRWSDSARTPSAWPGSPVWELRS